MLLLFLRNEWKPLCVLLCIGVVFFCGYHLNTLEQNAKVIKVIKHNDNIAVVAEKQIAKEQKKTDTINQKLKVIYAETGNDCFIPDNELRLLNAAR